MSVYCGWQHHHQQCPARRLHYFSDLVFFLSATYSLLFDLTQYFVPWIPTQRLSLLSPAFRWNFHTSLSMLFPKRSLQSSWLWLQYLAPVLIMFPGFIIISLPIMASQICWCQTASTSKDSERMVAEKMELEIDKPWLGLHGPISFVIIPAIL